MSGDWLPSEASIGSRIHVVGNTCSGKTTLGERLANVLGAPFVELDAINWQPQWVSLAATNPEEFERRLSEATADDSWVVAGSYAAFSQRIFWPRLQTVVWLDLPLPILLWRVVARSWRRWRSKELLWGTNRERFWPQLMIWNKEDSLIWWAVTQHSRKRRWMRQCIADPRWEHIRFVRLASTKKVGHYVHTIEDVLSREPVNPIGQDVPQRIEPAGGHDRLE